MNSFYTLWRIGGSTCPHISDDETRGWRQMMSSVGEVGGQPHASFMEIKRIHCCPGKHVAAFRGTGHQHRLSRGSRAVRMPAFNKRVLIFSEEIVSSLFPEFGGRGSVGKGSDGGVITAARLLNVCSCPPCALKCLFLHLTVINPPFLTRTWRNALD